ncbi:MAG: hypothetical protein NT045_09060 [Candidatus Aureabacteria bacterium]|nr:hypothetical protein [Candidatus Auribacterota bacterium]
MRDDRSRCPHIAHNGSVQNDLDFEIEFYRSIIDKDPHYVDALSLLGEAYTRKGLYGEGLRIDRLITSLRPRDPIAYYNLACSYSLIQRKREALKNLRKSIVLGYRDLEHLATDQDLACLHEDKGFHILVRRLCRTVLKNVEKRRSC